MKTSDLKDAGSTGRVFVQLCGEARSSEKHLVSSYMEDAFERGAVDEFLLESSFSLGPLTHLIIEHEGKCNADKWHLEHMEVTDINNNNVLTKS